MGQHVCAGPLAALAAGAIAWFAPQALAADADYCITCKNPDQIYRCRVTGVGSRPSDALKLYCVIRTAKEGNHASCSASAATPACDGLVKVYNYEGPSLEDIASDPRLLELKQRVDHDKNAFDKPKGDGPKTLLELGGRAVSASRKGLRNAGSAIGVTSPAATDTPAPAPPPPAADLPPAAPTASLPAETATSATEAEESAGFGQRVKQATQSSGAAVGGFARKSYRCVRSLFRNCSGDAENGALE